ncbi:hypothetical protein MMC13_003417 [Lambiella insularis]|nr:hypothetical protein [Lambiella insularis]
MAQTTLLQYLTSPNPVLDCTRSSTGTNTVNARWDVVTALQDWTDFSLETIMQSYSSILLRPIPLIPDISPALTELERKIFTERTFETVLERATVTQVSHALRVGWHFRYPDKDADDAAAIAKGDKTKRGTIIEDDRFSPDWAGIRRYESTNFGYKNLCPGATKLASKWSTSAEGQERNDFLFPLGQIQTYCGRLWGSRYGYIITPEELVVVMVRREIVDPGLANQRSARDVQRLTASQVSHTRTFSYETVRSEFQAMSLDTGSSFSDDANPDIEYRPLLWKSIPWAAAGGKFLTVKLALWYLLMLTKTDVTIQHSYPPLREICAPTSARTVSGPTEKKKSAQERDTGVGKKKR